MLDDGIEFPPFPGKKVTPVLLHHKMLFAPHLLFSNSFTLYNFLVTMISSRLCFQSTVKARSLHYYSASDNVLVRHRAGYSNPIQAISSAMNTTQRRKIVQLLTAGIFTSSNLRGKIAVAATTGKAEQVLQDPQWPASWPFQPDAFSRYDESSDNIFYDFPRFVTHIDDDAVAALTQFYLNAFPPSGQQDTSLLDICSSWISHYPKGYKAGRISGLGMNEEELSRNEILTDYTVKDLNTDPSLPYEDNTFDVITNAVSVDYLTKPLQIFKEMNRVLKPGGLAIMSFSNRCFPTKAISLWTSTGDLDHIWIVGSYYHYAGGYEEPEAREITKVGLLGQRGDPMYVVYGRKKKELA